MKTSNDCTEEILKTAPDDVPTLDEQAVQAILDMELQEVLDHTRANDGLSPIRRWIIESVESRVFLVPTAPDNDGNSFKPKLKGESAWSTTTECGSEVETEPAPSRAAFLR
jgi:hypothetical protein